MKNKVYIVSHGERCEGGSVVSVHHSFKKAIKAALAVECCFAGGWEQDTEDSTYWTNGCDFVCVEPYKVQP